MVSLAISVPNYDAPSVMSPSGNSRGHVILSILGLCPSVSHMLRVTDQILALGHSVMTGRSKGDYASSSSTQGGWSR